MIIHKYMNLSGAKGFTLIEILLAILISSILALGIHVTYRQALLAWSRTEASRLVYKQARMITETLRTELSCLYMPPTKKSDSSGEDSGEQDDNGAGAFILSTSSEGKLDMSFYTLGPAFESSPSSGRIAKVTYSFADGKLTRSEQYCAGEKIIGPQRSQVIAQDLTTFAIQTFVSDPDQGINRWQNSFTSSDIPPRAVKVAIGWPQDKNVPATDLETIFWIPCEAAMDGPSSP
ncbi:MAG: prepilin-type N-terminal cleavage/methylation domain-containing protein [Gammaproteobacteria bacterium]|nr:prepilin-type N-terminal cleavage/methylation domain-containing protein [Gammaproteobacteria bacterium]